MKKQNIKSNQEPELCPYMSLWALLGNIVVYCSFNSDEFRTDYDRCAIHDDWIKRDECPLHFTYNEVAEKVKALAEKEGHNVRKVFRINFESSGKRLGIFKDFSDNIQYHALHMKDLSKMSMDVMHVRITNLDSFTNQGFCWFDGNGEIKNSEPLKVGDIGYINLIDPKRKGNSRVVLELFAEDVGVELLDNKFVTTSSAEEASSKKE